ncbi:PQQ-binding-like beta-propeller repeat protein [Dactylosporangium sp. CS-047395]|uniref:PQQ-binding-like beta-propeller repeat protein n=1 Tax=Dactylosporangium sp. CS-047395 TaxID=3239936 RepID=UPI003D8EF8A2
MRLIFRFVPLVLVLSTLTPTSAHANTATPGYGTSADADWRQNGGDQGRSGHQALTGTLTAATAKALRATWSAPATRTGEQIGGAVVVDGTVFRSAGGPSGQIRRYDAATGDDLGPLVDEPGQAFGELAATGDTLVVESIQRPELRRTLRAYRRDGARAWTAELPDAVSGGFTVAGDIIVRGAGATLTAYRTADGGVAWSAQLAGEPGFHAPVRLGDLVLIATEPGNLQAFDARTGAPAWRRDVSGAEVVAAGDTVYTVGAGGVCAYAAAEGTQRWCDAQTLESPVHASAGDGALFVVDGHGGLAAFDAASGAGRWHTTYGLHAEVDASYWAPVNGGGAVYAMVYHFAVRGGVSTHRVELVAADARTGELIRRLDLDVDAMHGDEPLILAGDHLYFAAVQQLHALGIKRP